MQNWTRIAGLDLGQSGDPAAVAVIDRADFGAESLFVFGPPNPFVNKLLNRSLYAWPLGTSYPDIARAALGIESVDHLVVDYCGVGRPVVDTLREEIRKLGWKGKLHCVRTVASSVKAASTKMEARGLSYSVPKVELVSAILVSQQAQRLVLSGSEETKLLLAQLGDYQRRYSVSAAAGMQFGNASGTGKHDDLVTAIGLALWWALRMVKRCLDGAVYMPEPAIDVSWTRLAGMGRRF